MIYVETTLNPSNAVPRTVFLIINMLLNSLLVICIYTFDKSNSKTIPLMVSILSDLLTSPGMKSTRFDL